MKSNLRQVVEEKLDIALTFPEQVKQKKNMSDTQFEAYLNELQEQLEASKRGKRSRDKGNAYERKVAKAFNERLGTVLVRTPLSGGLHKSKESDMKGDLLNLDPYNDFLLHLECKNHKTWRLKDWIQQAQTEAQNKIPVLVIHQHQEHGDNPIKAEDYVVIKLQDFLNIINKEEVVRAKAKQRIKRKSNV